jgi:ABC-type dipeptide/oligopeptide/nickel transport system ATPase component
VNDNVNTNSMKLLEVNNLSVRFSTQRSQVQAVRDISFHINSGETLGIVGESGSGKSVTALALTRLLPAPPVCTIQGQILYKNQSILDLKSNDLRKIRGKEIAYIFQEPCSSLNPVFTIGYQIAETVKLHLPHVKDVKTHVIDTLHLVGIREPEKRYHAYPHEFSGGMQQRVMIAMALACQPRILVADEPTTALDVTTQKQILDLLKTLRERLNMSILLITHNFNVIDHFAQRVLVMFQGKIVEEGPTDAILRSPQHPYTRALIACIPKPGNRHKRLTTIDYTQLATPQ